MDTHIYISTHISRDRERKGFPFSLGIHKLLPRTFFSLYDRVAFRIKKVLVSSCVSLACAHSYLASKVYLSGSKVPFGIKIFIPPLAEATPSEREVHGRLEISKAEGCLARVSFIFADRRVLAYAAAPNAIASSGRHVLEADFPTALETNSTKRGLCMEHPVVIRESTLEDFKLHFASTLVIGSTAFSYNSLTKPSYLDLLISSLKSNPSNKLSTVMDVLGLEDKTLIATSTARLIITKLLTLLEQSVRNFLWKAVTT